MMILVYRGEKLEKSFEPRPVNKVKDLPDKARLQALLAPYWPVLREYQSEIATIFLVDEPYMHGINKDGMERLAADMRALMRVHEIADIPLGITFSAAMFDADFAKTVDEQASHWVHGIEQYYRQLQQSKAQRDQDELAQWSQDFNRQRLTTLYLPTGNIHYTTLPTVRRDIDANLSAKTL